MPTKRPQPSKKRPATKADPSEKPKTGVAKTPKKRPAKATGAAAVPAPTQEARSTEAGRGARMPPGFTLKNWRGFAVFQCEDCAFDTMDIRAAGKHCLLHRPRRRIRANSGQPTKG